MAVTTTARLRHCSVPPRKMRLVANLVKGMPIQKALDVLNFTKRSAAFHIAKTLKSAAANAFSMVGTDHVKPEDLFVKSITVDPAPSAKRIRFQSMGRVFRYRKRHSHLTIVLEERATTPAPVATKDKGKPTTEGEGAEAQVKKTAPKKAKSAAKKPAKKTPAKAAKNAAAKGKKPSPAKKSKKAK
ncbi:50S ribosomal protein L22 [candidate division GN15 bacterium]|uniref:Large ribosomal subunit protein uL22 n=1 Tax=candidate division GN15 bacterium TaxID=2072418 RepID=A0A855X9C4_9BACT|nr:MAG: 50S ribosomal protein L22 [candidate division GN15 bacterium]